MAYSVRFSGWGPVDFRSWPSDLGFAMRTKFEGRRRADGIVMGFFAYGFVETDALGRITRWETHVNRESTTSSTWQSASTAPSTAAPTTTRGALANTLQEAGVELPPFQPESGTPTS
jgi:hypothetical protein